MRVAGAEQNPVRDDDCCSASGLQEPQEQRKEQQLGLLCLHDLLEVLGRVLVIQRSGEGRIRQDERVALFLPGVVLREGVSVADVWVLHAM